ncbi:hypothetical protein N665_0259s0008, partial [Sinapis alba]
MLQIYGRIFTLVFTSRIYHGYTNFAIRFIHFVKETQSLWEELSSIQPPSRTIEDLLAEKETNRVIDFLMGLNDNYEHIRSRILMKKVLPTMSEVFNLLDQEDSQKSASSDFNSAVFQVSHPQDTGYGKTTHSSVSSASTGTSSTAYPRRDRPICTFCGRVGHIVDRCYKKHGYPASFKSKFKNDQVSPSVLAAVATTYSG